MREIKLYGKKSLLLRFFDILKRKKGYLFIIPYVSLKGLDLGDEEQ